MKGKVYKNTPRTVEQLKDAYTARDSSHQRRHFGKSIPGFGEKHSSVLGCERRPVSASIMSRYCFASFPVCVYKFSSHYLNNIIFIDNSLGPLATELPCIFISTRYTLLTLNSAVTMSTILNQQLDELRGKMCKYDTLNHKHNVKLTIRYVTISVLRDKTGIVWS